MKKDFYILHYVYCVFLDERENVTRFSYYCRLLLCLVLFHNYITDEKKAKNIFYSIVFFTILQGFKRPVSHDFEN
jgi:hypothetical protein